MFKDDCYMQTARSDERFGVPRVFFTIVDKSTKQTVTKFTGTERSSVTPTGR
jgi:hypothetical protein